MIFIMNLEEALKILGIEKYAERILESNSHGELFHLGLYFSLADALGETDWFADWFGDLVKWAEDNWERPESIFQHVDRILLDDMQNKKGHETRTRL